MKKLRSNQKERERKRETKQERQIKKGCTLSIKIGERKRGIENKQTQRLRAI